MPDPTGKLTEEDSKKIRAWLTSFGRPIPVCPICGDSMWTIGEHVVQPISIGSAGLQIGGVGYPQIMLVSNKCGYTMYVNAVVVGLIPSLATPVPSPPTPGS